MTTQYHVEITTLASSIIPVQAKSIEEAREKVENQIGDRDVPQLCAPCTGLGQKYNMELSEEWTIIDIEPATEVRVSDVQS
jgi:hypothetical protein